jgi:hypothetical protein
MPFGPPRWIGNTRRAITSAKPMIESKLED